MNAFVTEREEPHVRDLRSAKRLPCGVTPTVNFPSVRVQQAEAMLSHPPSL